jgi:PAS domain S-box-containing protein
VLSVGVLVLGLGWGIGLDAFKTLVPSDVPVAIDTAVCLVLTASALLLSSPRAVSRLRRRLASAAAALALLVALASLGDHVLAGGLGTDMAPSTAACFVLLGSALLLRDVRLGGRWPSNGLALLAGAIALVALVGYLTQTTSLQGIGSAIRMASATACSFLLLAAAVLLERPRGSMALFVAPGAGGFAARRMVPAILVIPLLIGGLRLAGQEAGWYGTRGGLWLMITSVTLIFAAVAWYLARLLERSDRELRRSREALRTITETAPDAMVIIDEPGKIVLVNDQAEKLFGWRREDLLGRPVEVLLPERFRAGHVLHRGAFLAEPMTRPMGSGLELYALDRERREIPVEISLAPMETEDGRFVSAAIRDVTQRKRLEENLVETQKLESLGVLAGGIAHDFNNLLGVVVGNAGLALADAPRGSRLRDALQEIVLAAERGSDLTRQMLAYSGMGRGVVEPVRLDRVVREVAALMESSVSEKAQLSVSCAPDTPSIEADPIQLRQVVLNLITNASEALGDDGGTIAIATGSVRADRPYLAHFELAGELPEGGYACLDVSDGGAGMDADTRARLFDPLFTTKFTGRGLGLSAVMGIVRGHGGAIRVQSEPGRGTSVKVLFPSCGAWKPRGAAAQEWRGSGTVLVAEDEELVRAMAARMLRRLGFTPVLVPDGAEALQALHDRQGEFALALLDVVMPGLTGPEVLASLNRHGDRTPVIVVSGFGSPELRERLASLGAAAFLPKPFDLEELRAAVRAATHARAAG